ncbi:cysteine desulfurase family protein [Flavobacterium sp. SUN046]|uniref:cysteine desulfurase family protein n=1 Tax=Flavobacterium sp. SUN046 TaxID=3002440 RepID=UPI002DB65649|nr:cysteine desulfurase family protein [Flavobacterium sp. SUN046]MEC4050641.1 cysteine desulfurase family protein [Flavobacterium sp. SUN046]
MEKIYLDNAATTPLRKEVIATMLNVLENDYGNASSTHSFGRSAKSILETSRKTIAKYLHCTSQEIVFTSNATEATNWILRSAVKDLGMQRIITSRVEHHATLYTINALQKEYGVAVDYINVFSDGSLDDAQLEALLNSDRKTIVSLMHVNNETGCMMDIAKVGNLCAAHNALFHCDTVQSIGKTELNLHELPVDFVVASAHKFHGPKGIGFAYVKKNRLLQPILFGGEQEKGLRAGTEAVHQVAGMAKALELAYEHLDEERAYIQELKKYCVAQLQTNFPDIKINGSTTFYNILNVLLPFSEEKTAMILFNLDMKGIAVSRGSACQSGSVKPSHVLAEMLMEEDIKKPSLRISFSHYNTKAEIDTLIDGLKGI